MSNEQRPTKRFRFADTFKVQPYDKCAYDIPFHQTTPFNMAQLVDAVELYNPTPPAPLAKDLDEYELLVEDFHPELELKTKPFDGESRIQTSVSGLLSLANVTDNVRESAVMTRLCLHDKLDNEDYDRRVLTVHSAIVDAKDDLAKGKEVCYDASKLPVKPDRLDAVRAVLGHIQAICARRNITIKKL